MSLIKKSTEVISSFFLDTTTNISNLNNNTLLEIEKKEFNRLKIQLYPMATIDGAMYKVIFPLDSGMKSTFCLTIVL